MTAETSSPFMERRDSNELWILWKKNEPVVCLDNRYAIQEDTSDYIESEDISVNDQQFSLPRNGSVQLNRHQYHSVLNQMHHAAKRAGAFSEWSPTNA